jgi:2-methylisocitrate lyase-like PEP mutase family enzyme
VIATVADGRRHWHSTHIRRLGLVEVEEMVQKVRAAAEARRSHDFLIIARTDARIHGSPLPIMERLTGFQEFLDIIGLPEIRELDRRFAH